MPRTRLSRHRKTAPKKATETTSQPVQPNIMEPLMQVFKQMGLTVVQAPRAVEGPLPSELKGKPIITIAHALNDYERWSAENRGGHGKEYSVRATQLRMLFWRRQYSVSDAEMRG